MLQSKLTVVYSCNCYQHFFKTKMMKARKYILNKMFVGLPKKEDFKIIEEELSPLKKGEFLAKAVYLSVDPYMRAFAEKIPVGSTMIGSQVAKIVLSEAPDYPVGRYVLGNFGWRDFTVASDKVTKDALGIPSVYLLPDFDGLPYSLGIGALGGPGITAYFGFVEICNPKKGETVVVTGAAGAVGSLVGQIAKIKGCKVIGVTGSYEKGKWLTSELGFDTYINYKKPNFAANLKQVAPNGIDCYFDNVGGEISSLILKQMNPFGRISVCGSISAYNATNETLAPAVQLPMIFNQLKMEGFISTRWYERWMEAILQLKQWIKEGKLKYKESVTEGFENMFEAFVGMLQGENIGKALVKA